MRINNFFFTLVIFSISSCTNNSPKSDKIQIEFTCVDTSYVEDINTTFVYPSYVITNLNKESVYYSGSKEAISYRRQILSDSEWINYETGTVGIGFTGRELKSQRSLCKQEFSDIWYPQPQDPKVVKIAPYLFRFFSTFTYSKWIRT